MLCAVSGRPGPVYIDLPGDFIIGTVSDNISEKELPPVSWDIPRCLANPTDVEKTLNSLLKTAKRPLIIIGKGAAYSRAELPIRQLIDQTNLPFLPTPMGKGLVSDLHQNCVSAARSFALKNADVILLLGARLNWILHFGQPPRFRPDTKFIQVDIEPTERINTKGIDPGSLFLLGDVTSVAEQLVLAHDSRKLGRFDNECEWWHELRASVSKNKRTVENLCKYDGLPMNYYRALHEIKIALPSDFILVSEGANTMVLRLIIFYIDLLNS